MLSLKYFGESDRGMSLQQVVRLEISGVVPSVKTYLDYRDKGCRQAREYVERKTGEIGARVSCLECPFYPGRCREDEGEMSYSAERQERDERIKKMRGNGERVDFIAMELKISRRTVARVLKKGE